MVLGQCHSHPSDDERTDLSEVTVREWLDKFREHIPDPSWLKPLTGTVQMDEASFKKVAVIAAKDIKEKRVVLRVLNHMNVGKNNIAQFVARHVEPGSKSGYGWRRSVQEN